MMRIRIGGSPPSGPAPKSAKVVQIFIVALMLSFLLFGLVLEDVSIQVRIAVGILIMLLTGLTIWAVTREPDISHYRKPRQNSQDVDDGGLDSFPLHQQFFHSSPMDSVTDTNCTSHSNSSYDSSSSTDFGSNFDSSPSFDSSSSFDSGSSSCGCSSNE